MADMKKSRFLDESPPMFFVAHKLPRLTEFAELEASRATEVSFLSPEYMCQKNIRLLVNQCLPSITEISSEVDDLGGSYIT